MKNGWYMWIDPTPNHDVSFFFFYMNGKMQRIGESIISVFENAPMWKDSTYLDPKNFSVKVMEYQSSMVGQAYISDDKYTMCYLSHNLTPVYCCRDTGNVDLYIGWFRKEETAKAMLILFSMLNAEWNMEPHT